jgi:aflatoxin B1 aldehyde reductase
VEKVYIYYLHAQDSTTPIEETMDAIQVLYKAGRFERVCTPLPCLCP